MNLYHVYDAIDIECIHDDLSYNVHSEDHCWAL